MGRLIVNWESQSVSNLPWQQNFFLDIILALVFIFLIAGIWAWVWSGRTKREKKVPFERAAEDFGGTIQAAYGQIPNFLILIYVVVFASMVGYIIVSIITGVQY